MNRITHLSYKDLEIEVRYLRRKRKTLAIHVTSVPNAVEVRMPLNCPWSEVDKFFQTKIDWIISSLDKLDKLGEQSPREAPYADGEEITVFGERYKIRSYAGRARVYLSGQYLMVRCMGPKDEGVIESLVHRFYRSICEPVFKERLALCRDSFPVTVHPTNLRLRKMKARWGSCSKKGEICLNTLLAKFDESLIDFVVTHELCHLVHFNHSPEFYALMDTAMPDWRAREARINNHGGSVD